MLLVLNLKHEYPFQSLMFLASNGLNRYPKFGLTTQPFERGSRGRPRQILRANKAAEPNAAEMQRQRVCN